MHDLTNPGVLKNFLISQMKEGNGKFEYKHNVLVFKDQNGNEFVAPKEVEEYLDEKDMPTKKIEKSEPVKKESKKSSKKVTE